MTKLFPILLLLILAGTQTKAQNDTLYSDSTNGFSTTHMLDSCFRHVDMDEVPTGYLADKALPTADLDLYTGELTDSNETDHFIWRRVYGTLRRASTDSATAKDTLGLMTLLDTMQAYVVQGLVPVSILNYQYSRIKPDAFSNHLLTMIGVEIADAPGRTESPYETHTCFVAAPGVLYADSPRVPFIFPSTLYAGNDTRIIDYLEVNFGDGNGWRTVAFDQVVLIDYDTPQTAEIVVKLHFTNSTSLQSHLTLKIKEGVYLVTRDLLVADEFYVFESDKTHLPGTLGDGKGRAYVSIHYGCNNTDKKLRRPFIVAGGFHIPATNFDQPLFNGPIYGKDFFDPILRLSPNSYYEILSQEYDLVFIDFAKPSDYIQRNAYVLEKIIKWVNETKAANGSKAKNVVFGNSLGGIIGRYAIGELYQEHLAHPGNAAYPHHDVKVFYTHDSPHRGANSPLGVQAMIKALYQYYFVVNSLCKAELWEVNADYLTLTCPSVHQLLINHIIPGTEHTDFYATLNTVAPLNPNQTTLGCKFVAICNGSGDAVPQGVGTYIVPPTTPPSWIPLQPQDILLSHNYSKNGYSFLFFVWAVPDQTSLTAKVFEGAIIYTINNQIIHPFYANSKAVAAQKNGLDGAPGSAGNTGAIAGAFILGGKMFKSHALVIHSPYQCFIPSISSAAVDLSITNYYYQINASPSNSLAARILVNDDNSADNTVSSATIANGRNGSHAIFTEYTAKIFDREMLYMAPDAITFGSTLLSGYTFNYGGPLGEFIGSLTVNGTLAVNKNVVVGYSGALSASDVAPLSNTNFRVETIKRNECVAASTSLITINGTLQLGDPSGNRNGDLVINAGSKMVFNNNSVINIYGQSRLIIEDGAELEINGIPVITMDGDEAGILIKGSITMATGAQFNPTCHNGGRLMFHSPSGIHCINSIANSTQVNLTGDSRTTPVLEIMGKGADMDGLDVLNIETGTILMGENSELVVRESLTLDLVRVSNRVVTDFYNGIISHAQQGSATVTITDCLFEHGNVGFTKSASSTLDLLNIQNTVFITCAVGLRTYGDACNLDHVRFDECDIGWEAIDMTATSDFKGYCEDIANYGIKYGTSNSSANLYVYESKFLSCAGGMYAAGPSTLMLQCVHFDNNNIDIDKNDGKLNISYNTAYNIYRSDGTTSVHGGDNVFDNASNISIHLLNTDNVYLDGYNQFTFSTNPYRVMNGNLSTTLPGTQNWSSYL